MDRIWYRILLLLATIAVVVGAEAQNVTVSVENLHMENGRLERGIVICERVPIADFRCSYTYWELDSVWVSGMLYDPLTKEVLPYPTVYAVHRNGNGYVVDSVVKSSYMALNFGTPPREQRLFAVHTLGYRPVLVEFTPAAMPEMQKVSLREYERVGKAPSPEGYMIEQTQDSVRRIVWRIFRIDGFEQQELQPIVFYGPEGWADEFRWAPGGWLYIKRGDNHYKLHVDIPLTQNCRMKDVEVSEEEFKKAMLSDQYNQIRSDRAPDAADTVALHAWARREFLPVEFVNEESGYVRYEGGYECLEIAVGDYCCTLLKHDTTAMQSCDMSLSADIPHYFGGVNMEWGAGDSEVPAYIYIYPLLADGKHVGEPYIYQTTPAWAPTGRYGYAFWGEGGWFYVEGYIPHTDRTVYHKVHLPF